MGFCTLREAIANANAMGEVSGGHCTPGTGTDTINFSVSGTITLGVTLPTVVSGTTLTIDGTGQTIIVSGGNSVEVGQVADGGSLTLNKLSVANGNATLGAGFSNDGTLAITKQ